MVLLRVGPLQRTNTFLLKRRNSSDSLNNFISIKQLYLCGGLMHDWWQTDDEVQCYGADTTEGRTEVTQTGTQTKPP